MKKCFIDTNIIKGENYFRSTRARLFLRACNLQDIKVIVPEIVLDETIGNFRKDLKACAASLRKSEKGIKKLIDIEAQDFSIDEKVSTYEQGLKRLLNSHQVKILPYPEILPKELVLKSYEGKKPFKSNGIGHKDYVVWKTINNNIKDEQSEKNYFLVQNTSDFCEQIDSNWKLHSELQKEIENDDDIPLIYLSLKEFFNTEIEPNLENLSLDDLEALGLHDIESLTEEFLFEELEEYTAYGFEGVPFANEVTAQMISSPHISNIELHKIEDEIIIKVQGTIDIHVNGFMEKSDYIMAYEFGDTDISVLEGDWNEHVMFVSTETETEFETTFIYSTETKEILNRKFELPQEIEDEWPYK